MSQDIEIKLVQRAIVSYQNLLNAENAWFQVDIQALPVLL